MVRKLAALSVLLSVIVFAPIATAAVESTVYVTRTGDKYHVDGCRYLRKSKIAKKLSEAKKNYSPCSVCKPPTK